MVLITESFTVCSGKRRIVPVKTNKLCEKHFWSSSNSGLLLLARLDLAVVYSRVSRNYKRRVKRLAQTQSLHPNQEEAKTLSGSGGGLLDWWVLCPSLGGRMFAGERLECAFFLNFFFNQRNEKWWKCILELWWKATAVSANRMRIWFLDVYRTANAEDIVDVLKGWACVRTITAENCVYVLYNKFNNKEQNNDL